MTDSARRAKVDSILNMPLTRETVQGATNLARQVKSQVMNANLSIDNFRKELAIFEIQWHKILANSFACIAMFLIGAPLGAIIKKGGLGRAIFGIHIFLHHLLCHYHARGEASQARDR